MLNLDITKKGTQIILLIGAVIIYLHPVILLLSLLGYFVYLESEKEKAKNDQIKNDREIARILREEEKRKQSERRAQMKKKEKERKNDLFYREQYANVLKRAKLPKHALDKLNYNYKNYQREMKEIERKEEILRGLRASDRKIIHGEGTSLQRYGLKPKAGQKRSPNKLNHGNSHNGSKYFFN